ncbi:MAG TPA: GntR family transcriptional regulator [Aggregatilineaceae bacterium]|nr:GntR family transcriptional regulator [Aggregatilineaceae bacterium]
MDAALQRDSDVPLYLQITEILKQKIVQGGIAPDKNLPAEPELCEHFGVARGTIRQALSKLESEGYVRREQGRGTFVVWGIKRSLTQQLVGNQIGFVVPYVRDSFMASILLGAERAASEHKLSITFKHVENDVRRQAEVLDDLAAQRLAGILLYPVNSEGDDTVQRLILSGYPMVLVDRYLRKTPSDFVMSDHFGGALRATQHLILLGHQRIGFVSWRDASISLEHREAGYRQALTEMGIPYDSALTVEVESYPRILSEPLQTLFNRELGITAVMAANDQIALAVYQTARKNGVRVPEDLALVGFDNLDFTAHLDTPLTTVEQPTFEIGQTAVETLVRRINDENMAPQRVILPTKLIVRQSCGAHLRLRAVGEGETGQALTLKGTH